MAETKEEFIKAVNLIFERDYNQFHKREEILKKYEPLKLAQNLIDIINQNLI